MNLKICLTNKDKIIIINLKVYFEKVKGNCGMKIINNIWPEWHVEKEIGQGSYGKVYKCFKSETQEYCAIKVISIPQNEQETGDVLLERMTVEETKEYYKDIVNDLLKEIEILKALKGTKNVVEIYDAQILEKEAGIGWNILIRMEFLTDFNTYVSDKQLTEKDVIKLGTDLGSALSVCHKAKIIHRDIKPENILVDAEGNFKLSDFGVAKQMEKTQGSMSVKGTYNYMSPEVFAGKKCDGRADMYSLALVMYKLLNNNRLPFIDPNKQIVRYNERQEAFEKRINGEELPKIQGISDELNEVILTACSFKAIDRQRDIDTFANELKLLSKGKSVKLRNAIKYISIAVASIICIGAIFFGVKYFTNKPEEDIEPNEIIEDSTLVDEENNIAKDEEIFNNVVSLSEAFGDITFSDDGQYLIVDDSNNQYYMIDTIDEKYTNINGLIKENSEFLTVLMYDEDYIYYSLDKNNQNVNWYESGYDLYRFNRKTKGKELLMSVENRSIASIIYCDNEYIYLIELEGIEDVMEFEDYYNGIFRRKSLKDKSEITIAYGVANPKFYNGNIIYYADVETYFGAEPLWIYNIVSQKSYPVSNNAYETNIEFITEDEFYFQEKLEMESDSVDDGYHIGGYGISKYNIKTKEKTVVANFNELITEDFRLCEDYVSGTAITEKQAYASFWTSNSSVEVYSFLYDNSSCQKTEISIENLCNPFIDKHVSSNTLFYVNEDNCSRLYEILSSGRIQQVGGDIYVNNSYEIKSLGSKLIAFTGDKQKSIKFYDYLDYNDNTNVTFIEEEEEFCGGKEILVISNADMRVGPEKSYEKIGVLKKGEQEAILTATGSNGWSRIEYTDGTVAYVETKNIVGAADFLYSGNCGINAKWSFDEVTQTLNITGNGDMIELTGNVASDYCVPWMQYTENIKMVNIENGITSIGSYSFDNCENLTSITIPNSVKAIKSFAFSDCNSLTSVIIPKSVQRIEYYAFSNCENLTSITIGDSITYIDAFAFGSCYNLTDIYYAGTEEQWTRCYMGSGENIDDVTIHYNSK